MNEQSATDERFAALVKATSDVIYRLSADWEVMYELDGRGFLKSTSAPIRGWRERNVHALDMEMVNEAINHAISTKTMFELEHRVIRNDGSTGWTLSRAVPILDPEGMILEWFGTARDITLRKEAEAGLQAAKDEAVRRRQVYESVTINTPDLVYVFELDYTFSYANRALLEMWGKTWDEAVAKSLLENGYEPWHAEMHEREIDHIVATGEQVRGEVGFPHAVLGRRVYDYILTPVFDVSGKVVAVSGVTRDVTDRKAEELEKIALADKLAATNAELATYLEKLTKSETKLRYLISNAPVAIALLTGREMIVETANQKILEIWGKDDQVLGMPLIKALPELEGQPFPGILDEVFRTGVPYIGNEARVLLEGRELFISFVYQPIIGEQKQVEAILVTATDLTELVRSRHKIEAAKESLRMAIDAAELGSFSINIRDKTFVYSSKLKSFFGYLPDDELSYDAVLAQVHEDYRQAVSDRAKAVFEKGESFDMEYPVVGFRDGKLRWLRGIGTVQHEDHGVNSYFTGVIHEITERKMDEIRKNDFIGMVSHELKTPLTAINGNVQLMERRAKKNKEEFFIAAAGNALKQVKKMSSMINGFLNISRLESGKIVLDKTEFDLRDLILESIEESSQLNSSHHIRFGDCGQLPLVADRGKIESVLSNLLSNAVKYSPAGSEIEVHCESSDVTTKVSVADNGSGIRPGDLEKIFDRYYRVEENVNISGFGIGLYLSAEIIQRHGGKIWVESELGKGSIFHFELPLTYQNGVDP